MIQHIINKIKGTIKRTEKEQILKDYKENKELRDVLYFVYNPYIVTGLSKKKLDKKISIETKILVNSLSEMMTYLRKHNTGKDEDIAVIQQYLSQITCIGYKNLIFEIATKNLKMGITAKTLNKIFSKDFIPMFEVMLAKNYKEFGHKIVGSFTLTTKFNGMRCVLIKRDGSVSFMTRQGHVITELVDIEKDVKHLPDNYVYDGEIIYNVVENINGEERFNKTVSLARTDGIKKSLSFHVFDGLPLKQFLNGESKFGYSLRRKVLTKYIQDLEYIKLIPTIYVGSDKELIDYFSEKAVLNGEEGLMLNLNNGKYQCKRTDVILKVIKYWKADVLVTGIKEGTNKNKNKLGAIEVEFIYNGVLYRSDCGTGFSDKERKDYWKNKDLILGKIVTIEFKGYSQNKDGSYGSYGLRNASWKSIIRDDKTEISMH